MAKYLLWSAIVGGMLAVVLGARVLASPRGTTIQTNSATAENACNNISNMVRAHGPIDQLAGAFAVTADDVVAWQAARYGSQAPRMVGSNWEKLAKNTPLIACFFDGKFSGFSHNPRGTNNTYDRVVMIIDQLGRPTLDTAGYRATTVVQKPTRTP